MFISLIPDFPRPFGGRCWDIFKVYLRYIINLLSDGYMSDLASMLSVTDLTAHKGVENWQGMLQVIEIEITYLL